MDDLNNVNKIVQTFKPFASYIDHYQITEAGYIDIKKFVENYKKAQTGEVIGLKSLIRKQLDELNGKPQI
jgi:hypothetical protein